jgi:hypothetical protein
MRNFSGFIVNRLMTGVLVVAPIYLTALLLLKAAKSLLSIVQPVAKLLPEWMPAAQILSLLMIAGDKDHLPMGIGVEGSSRCHEKRKGLIWKIIKHGHPIL